jgi:hypothetical protein
VHFSSHLVVRNKFDIYVFIISLNNIFSLMIMCPIGATNQRIDCCCCKLTHHASPAKLNLFSLMIVVRPFVLFSFGHYVVCSSSIYGFWLPLWYFETLAEVDVRECYSIFSFMCMFCRSLFVLFYFFCWPLCCLFFDIWILIAPLVSSNSSFCE